jgi:hypothetical protein
MKTIEQLAKKKAYKLFFSTSNIILSNNNLRVTKWFDMRTKLDQKAILIFMQLVESIDKKKILQIKVERAKIKKVEFDSILQNELLIDFQRNKGLKVFATHLSDGYRKHWAKSEQDFKVLQVLKKYYPN